MVELGLIGWPLSHSFSPDYFKVRFDKEGVKGRYDLFPIDSIDKIQNIIEEHPDLKGLNVTLPYKQMIIPFIDVLSEHAEEIGAVNVIKITRESKSGEVKLKGFNSDWLGFRDSLKPLLRPDIKSALILGTGGASKAIEYALKTLGIKYMSVSRQNIDKKPGILTYGQLDRQAINSHLLIVNTTPLGMWPETNDVPQIPYELITDRHICYDLIYNPSETRFLKLCKEKGAVIKNGLEMLHRQAEVSWNIFMDNNIS